MNSIYCHPRNYYVQRKSPINNLPVELLSYIFILSTHSLGESNDVHEEAVFNEPFNTESVRTPLVLSSVNHHWRTVALTTPALWTSLCVTIDSVECLDDSDSGSLSQKPGTLNATHLTSYLALSRNYPLDIFIDARDQEWDFSDAEYVRISKSCFWWLIIATRIPSEYEFSTYTPPFSSVHMGIVISLLLPHLSRWRSIDILTDTWAPMYVALHQINTNITSFGAPLLESLTLMRCNDFVSYSHEFQPREMKDPVFLTFGADLSTQSRTLNVLPRLRDLTLRGVHVDWSSLPHLLPRASANSETGLRTLELAYHSPEVRPTLTEFRQLLTSCPKLERIVINGSGPVVPDDITPGSDFPADDQNPISLPKLEAISLGYRSAHEGRKILELLDAPNVKVMTLEDATHPADPEDVDAGCLLRYVGTGEIHDDAQDSAVAYATPDGLQYQIARDLESDVCVVPHDDASDTSDERSTRPPFPLLESITLRSVKACPRPFHAFFRAVPNLKRLELIGMSMYAIQALLPQSPWQYAPGNMCRPCPCPQLQSLCIRGFDRLKIQDFDFIVGSLAVERVNKGACGLREVDIHVDNASGCGEEDLVRVSSGICGMEVKVFREALRDEYEDMDCSEGDAFKVGGVFNDPVFDAYYGGGLLPR